jgi:hypothetical protein
MVLSFSNAFWRSQNTGAAVLQRQGLPNQRNSAIVSIPQRLRFALQLALLVTFVPVLTWSQGTYTTNFPATENPISEGGRWVNGAVTGLDWSNVQTIGGVASGPVLAPGNYNDPTALLTGSWGPDQTAQATVYSIKQSDSIYEEVEFRLRSSLSAHVCTGYEVNFRVSSSGGAYMAIVRWNGPLGDFTYLAQYYGAQYGVSNGDVVKASIIGSTITVYKNGTQIGTATDNTYKSGAPGIGFDGPVGTNANWGFSSFSVTDGTTQSTQNFTLSATPSSQTVPQGTSAAYTVAVAPSGGFTGAVALSASGLPAGATVTFNPTSITTSGSSAMTVTTASTTPLASSALTIKGTSGGVTQTATAKLAVTSSGGTSSGGLTACDVNKDGTANVVDVQVATNNYLSCSTSSFQTFVSQVINGVLVSCSTSTGLHTVALSWGASTTSGVAYNVYRATTSGGYNYSAPLNSTPISGTSFTDCTIGLGQTYYYVIRAVDSSGNQSVNSSETAVTVPSS